MGFGGIYYNCPGNGVWKGGVWGTYKAQYNPSQYSIPSDSSIGYHRSIFEFEVLGGVGGGGLAKKERNMEKATYC